METKQQNAWNDLNKFEKIRQSLIVIINEKTEVIQSIALTNKRLLELISEGKELNKVVDRMTFKLMILGEFSAGKSTFINAMLRDRILPSYWHPTTAVINEIIYGSSPKATLHYRQDEHGIVKPPHEVPWKDLEKYLVVDSEHQEIEDAQIYSRVVLEYPLDLLKLNVGVVDSPGLNENISREEMSLLYLRQVDAVIFVSTVQRMFASLNEKEVLKKLRLLGHEDIFFIVNQFDTVMAHERDSVMSWVRKQVGQWNINHGSDWIFFVSARDALDGLIAHNTKKVEDSRFLIAEKAITNFLGNERGRAKVDHAVNWLDRTFSEIDRFIVGELFTLRKKLDEYDNDFASVQRDLDNLDKGKKNIVTEFATVREDIRLVVTRRAETFYQDIGDQAIEWAREHQLENSLSIGDILNMSKASKMASEEIMVALTKKSTTAFGEWQNDVLTPELEQYWNNLSHTIDQKLDGFFHQLNNVHLSITGIQPETNKTNQIGMMERIFAGALGQVVAGPALGAMGAVFGFREMMKAMTVQLLVSVGITVISGFNPLIIIPALLATGTVQALFKMNATNDKIKEQVGEAFRQKSYDDSKLNAQKIADLLDEKLKAAQELLEIELESRIAGIRTQHTINRDIIVKGQEAVDTRMKKLEDARSAQQAVQEKLNGIKLQMKMN